MGDPTPVKLSLNQVAVLAILMAEARELSNTDLRELAGVTLTGTDRTGLSRLKLVEERKVGNTYYFELSPAGWSTAAGLLAEQSLAKGLTKGAATGALLALLGGVARGLAGQGHDPRAFFRGTPDPRAASTPAAGTPADNGPGMPAGNAAEPPTPNAADVPAPNAAGVPAENGAALTVDPATTAPVAAPVGDLEAGIRAAYRSLARQPADWVGLADLRERLGDAPRGEVDAALRRIAVKPGVRLIPIANLKSLTARDREAALRLGGEDNHALAIEAR